MNNALVVIGTIILVASVFGISYAEQQQGLINEAEDVLRGEQQNWELLESISMAGIPLGLVLIIIGILPRDRHP